MNPIADCEAKINRVREDFFLGLTRTVAGFRIRPMKVRDYILLDRFNSPLLTKQEPSDLEIGMFLWWLSPQFDRWCVDTGWRASRFGGWIQSLRAWIFARRVRLALGRAPNDKWEGATKAAAEYISDTFQDRPMGNGGEDEQQYVHLLESYYERFKHEHGWFSREQFLDMQMTEVFASLRSIILRNGGKLINKATHDKTGDILTRLTFGELTPEDIHAGRMN